MGGLGFNIFGKLINYFIDQKGNSQKKKKHSPKQ